MSVEVNDLYRALLLSAAILATMVLGDALVYSWPKWVPQTVWALLDAPVHLLLALLVVSPLFAHPAISRDLWLWLALTAGAAVLIDLDHFVAARSFSIEAAITLDNRPFGHSLLFVLALALLTLLISRQPLGALLILGALLSHIVRDASHGSIPLWWPLPGAVTISIPLYYALQLLLGLSALWIVGRTAQTTWMDWVLTLISR